VRRILTCVEECVFPPLFDKSTVRCLQISFPFDATLSGSPEPPANDSWGFAMNNIPSGQQTQYNVTIHNSSVEAGKNLDLNAEIVLIILLPKSFTVSQPAAQSGWDPATILINPDGSTFLKVNTTATSPSLVEGAHITFSFNATAPVVTENSLYVFQTTTFYPAWADVPEIASSVSEAGIVVRP